MNARTAHAGLIFITLLFSVIAVSHPASDDFSKAKLLKGYVRRIAGETLDYYCFNPLAKTSLLAISPPNVIASSVYPCAGGRGLIVRLYNAGGVPEVTTVVPADTKKAVYASSPFEERGDRVERISLPPHGIVTLRIE